MNLHDAPKAALALAPCAATFQTFQAAADDGRSAQPSAAEARLFHLFRASLKSGRVHPLYQPMLSYRQARAAG